MRAFRRMLYCTRCASNTLHVIRRKKAVCIGYINIHSTCTICNSYRGNTLTESNLVKLADRKETDPPESQLLI